MKNLPKCQGLWLCHFWLFIFFLLAFSSVQAQFTAQWVCQAGGNANDQGWKVELGPEGEVYQIGVFESVVAFGGDTLTSFGMRDGFISRYDTTGNLLWVRQIGGQGVDVPLSVSVDASGNAFVCGYFSDSCLLGAVQLTSAGGEDLFLCKFAADGTLLWVKNAGSSNDDRATGIVADGVGGGWLTGYFVDSLQVGPFTLQHHPNAHALILARFDGGGNVTWARTASGSTYGGVKSSAITLDNEGNCFIAGNFYQRVDFDSISIGAEDAFNGYSFLAKFNSSGQALWARDFGNAWGDETYGVKTDQWGNAFVAGHFWVFWNVNYPLNPMPPNFQESGSYGSGYLAKFSSSGDFRWVTGSQPYSSMEGGDSRYADLHVTPDGISYINGYFAGDLRFGGHTVHTPYNGPDKALFISFDGSGTARWAHPYAPGNNYSRGQGIAVGTNNSLYLSGFFVDSAHFNPVFNLTSAGGADAFLARFSLPFVNAAPEAVLPLQTVQIYPNPSAGSFYGAVARGANRAGKTEII